MSKEMASSFKMKSLQFRMLMAIMAPAAFMPMLLTSAFIRGLGNLAIRGDLETRVGETLYGIGVKAPNLRME